MIHVNSHLKISKKGKLFPVSEHERLRRRSRIIYHPTEFSKETSMDIIRDYIDHEDGEEDICIEIRNNIMSKMPDAFDTFVYKPVYIEEIKDISPNKITAIITGSAGVEIKEGEEVSYSFRSTIDFIMKDKKITNIELKNNEVM